MIEAASGLTSKGHYCVVGCLNNSIIQQKANEKKLSTILFNIKSDLDIFAMFKLQKILNQLNIDILICCQNKDVKIGGRAGRNVGLKGIYSRQGLQLFTNKKRYRYPFTKLVDGIITNTETIKAIYESFGWFRPGFIKVIYNGMTLPKLDGKNRKAELFGVNENETVVFSAGRLSHQKGFEFLIEAAKICFDEHKEYHFFIAGTGKLEEKLMIQIKNLGLEKIVTLMGFKENLSPYYQNADVFVLPSLFEGMPNVVMESMANGTPAILTRVNGAEELVEHGRNGIIIEPGNPELIATTLDTYFSLDTDRSLLSKNARQTVKKKFTTEIMCTQLEQIFAAKLQN